MSVLIMQLRTGFKILAKNKSSALKAVMRLPGKERNLDLVPDNHFEFMKYKMKDGKRRYDFENLTTLEDVLRHWWWEPEFDEFGNIVKLTFNGLSLGDSDIMLAAIAPWVEDGSFVEFATEEALRFRFDFQGGKMTEVNLKKIKGLETTDWDTFWAGKIVVSGVFTHRNELWRVERVKVNRALSLEFTKEEIHSQIFLEIVPKEGAFIFATQESTCYVFRIGISKSTKGDNFPLMYFVCKLKD